MITPDLSSPSKSVESEDKYQEGKERAWELSLLLRNKWNQM